MAYNFTSIQRKYFLHNSFKNRCRTTHSIVEELKEKGILFPIVRSYNDCSTIYVLIKGKLEPAFTDPPICPNFTCYRIIDKFTEVLIEEKKDEVFLSFSVIGGTLQLLKAAAFGISIDYPDIRRIVHWASH